MEYDKPFEPDSEPHVDPDSEPDRESDSEPELGPDVEERGPVDGAPRRERRGRSPAAVAIGVTLLLLLASGAYWWLVLRQPPKPDLATPPPARESPTPQPAATGDGAEGDGREALELPPLSRSDAFVRDVALRLSEHPALVRWLAHEDLVRRFVAGTSNVAAGESPRTHVEFMTPEEPFRARRVDGELVAHPRAYGRYDLAVDVFTSVDIGAAVDLYYQMEPLLDDAYAEIGEPGTTFRGTLARALDRLLAVEIPPQPPELEEAVISYRYADPELENLDAASKHLLRLGPERAARVQTKLRFLRDALDLETPTD